MPKTIRAGFIGAGGIARAHAFAMQAMKYYYSDAPVIVSESVTSLTRESRDNFAGQYRFNRSQSLEEFAQNSAIDTVFILGPNSTHYSHLNLALQMPGVERIYLEKPVCSTFEEEKVLTGMAENSGRVIQTGFQYLQVSAVREALNWWKSKPIGMPVHFDMKYYHGDYLREDYRLKRRTRLTPAPDGGAMADLGCHGISLLMAFLGEDLAITGAVQGGRFPDVPDGSDLFSTITLTDRHSGAVGTLSASRISAGSGDLVKLEIFAERGAFSYSNEYPDSFRYFLEGENCSVRKPVGSNYIPVTSFPGGHVAPGWLRALIHAHYLFMGGSDPAAMVPDLAHGLAVQRLVRETAVHLENFRRHHR